MAESSILWQTNNTGDGSSSGYTQTQLFQMMRSFARTTNQGGVFPDVLNELSVSGTASPITVNTGQAIVYGIPYFNTSSLGVTIATPASQTRVDYIVLRASWAAQTVRVTRIAGTEGAGAPSLTQTAGTTWDIPLATASITTGGIITITDMREWALGIGDLTIDSTKLAANAVTNAKLATMNANTVKANNTGSSAVPSDVDVATLLAAYIHGATAKSTPVSADEVALIDSAASNVLKKVTLTNLLAAAVTTSAFLPALSGSVSSSGITYSTQSGIYALVGKLVFFSINVALNSKGTASGTISITGFPLNASDSSDFVTPVYWTGSSSTFVNMHAVMFASNASCELRAISAASTTLFGDSLTFAEINNDESFHLSGWYITT